MASVQNFIKWFKDRTKKPSKSTPKASIVRLGKLPPVPPKDEYGFQMRNTENHIYEEIQTMTSEDECGTIIGNEDNALTETVAHTLQKFDFTHAKEIGPYLVVPIVSEPRDGDESCDSGTGDLADLILSESVNDSTDSLKNTTCSTPKDLECNYTSLYSSIPLWARAKLKNAQCKRHGLALKDELKEEGLDETFNEYNINDLSSISSCSDHMTRCPVRKLTNRCCGSSDSSDSAKTFSEYDIDDYDNPLGGKDYEYFLVKAEKNFLLEKELKRYIDEASDSVISSSSSSQSDSMSLTTVTSMSDVSTIFAHDLSPSETDLRVSSDDSLNSFGASEPSCCCCKGQENSLFCAKATNSVKSVLLVQKTPRKGNRKSRRRSESGERQTVRDSSRDKDDLKICANITTKTPARRHSVDNIISHSSRRHSVEDVVSNVPKGEFKFTRSNTLPAKELEKQIRRDMRRSQKEKREEKGAPKTGKPPKEYKLPGVTKEYVFTTDSEYKFCTNPSYKNGVNKFSNADHRHSDRTRYSCRATDFVPKKPATSLGGVVCSTDDPYGSIYGTIRGRASQGHCQNRLLGDMMRMNHDRQLFYPF